MPRSVPPILIPDSLVGSLAPEAVALSARRLGIAAAIAAVAHVIYVVLYGTVWAAAGNPVGMAIAIAGAVISFATAAYLLTGTRPVSWVVTVGICYEVALALSMAISDTWTTVYSEPTPQVSWSAVVIVLFPFLIPARPAVVLGASMLSAAMTPLGMALVFGVTGREWPPAGVLTSYLLPPFICAALAWAPTSALSQLSAVAQQARRLGNYELTERLGAGGMGEVWLAKHRLLARPAAVKLIKPEMLGAKDAASRQTLLRRFEREAQVTANLESPHTVELYDFGVSPDGVLFYVMELLHGVDLDTLVGRFGPLPSERVVHFLLQACDSLEDAHRRGLIHRDIKPANLFVSRKGTTVDFLKVVDFGLVKRSDAGGEDIATSPGDSVFNSKQTDAGQFIGTPAFMPPEGILGDKLLDHRADIYALGCVGYWMLTGQLVFDDGTTVNTLAAHVVKQPVPPSKRVARPISPELERVVLGCLHKDREQRPPSAEALRVELGAIPLAEPWSRERATAWWTEHMPTGSEPPPDRRSTPS